MQTAFTEVIKARVSNSNYRETITAMVNGLGTDVAKLQGKNLQRLVQANPAYRVGTTVTSHTYPNGTTFKGTQDDLYTDLESSFGLYYPEL